MSEYSIPDEPLRVEVFWGVSAHLAFVPESFATECPLCHRTLSQRGDAVQPPQCERCGQPFHYKCYTAAGPAGRERDFFTGPDGEPPYPLFLCTGCRS